MGTPAHDAVRRAGLQSVLSLSRALGRRPIVVIAAIGLITGLALRSDTVFLVTLVAGGVPLVAQTLRGMLRGRFAADIVAMLAIVTALVLGQYFAGVVIVLMQSGGEALEAYAMHRASSSLESLLARAPKIAHRLHGANVEDVPVEVIAVGDALLVRPGDLVPVDAEVTDGTSSVDQSALTGEPLPVRAVAGTHLMSGSVNLDGALRVRALRPSAQSQYQQIVQLVERARLEKPPIQRLADRFAVWFTPTTLVMCGVAYLVTGTATSVLAVLVVATPCPLILATPVAVIAGISRAADLGVIVKHGRAIEQLGRAQAVVFDKTGTLTLGQPTVAHVEGLDDIPAGEVLRLAGAVEQLSSHHLAHAVVDASRERLDGDGLPPVSEFRETPGRGVSGLVEGRQVHVGSLSHLRDAGITIPPSSSDGTSAHVAVDGRIVGAIQFADRLRHQVPSLMQHLAVLGVRDTVMLTGDREAPAEAIAAQAGIRTVRANLLPADKVAAVKDLVRRHGNVIMVGDGINDAPALAAATVGVAMGAHGTAVSAEAADVVLLVDDIARVGDAMAVSRRMRRIALQSIGVGLGVSFALMIVASLGYITPAAGAVMQEALDAAVILNALRVRVGAVT
ncbi:MAG TPA: heavy metal translocating P-type ATPase [Gemmatimonadales bacterium]|nr:heavy metal translocating P-type ATPase [Gemmatimonadales bacterium]